MAESMQSANESSEFPSLVVKFGSTRRKDRPLTKLTTMLGRSRACDVTLDAPDVAAMHCLITRTNDGEIYIRDCQSRSGTLLNEQPIREAIAKDGDTLQIGPFTFSIKIPAVASATTSASLTTATTAQESQAVQRELQEQRQQLEQQLAVVELRQTELEQAMAKLAEDQQGLADDRQQWDQEVRANKLDLDQQREKLEQQKREWDQVQSQANSGDSSSIDEQVRRQIEAEAREKMRAEMEAGELSVLHSEIDRLNNVIQEAKEEKNTLAAELEHMKSAPAPDDSPELDRLREETSTLTQRLEAIAKERDELAIQLQSRPETSDEIAPELEDLRKQLADSESRFERLSHESERKLASMRADLEDERRRTKELVKDAAADFERTRKEIASLQQQVKAAGGDPQSQVDPGEVQRLEAELATAQQTIAQLQQDIENRPQVPSDLQEYEDQLNEFRDSLEQAQNQLETQEQELKNTVKETELQLSKDRANLARQQAELERLRTELKVELEHAEREAAVQAKLAPVQKLKDEMRQTQNVEAPEGSTPLAERIRKIIKRMG